MLPFEGGLTGTENGTLLFSALFAASYLLYGQRRFTPAKAAAKTAAVGMLAVLSIIVNGPLLLTVALALCALGDLLLALEERYPGLFTAGLAAFLAGHLAYVWLFLALAPFASPMPNAMAAILAFAMLALVGYLVPRLWNATGPLRLPVMAYVLAILAMGASAVAFGAPMVIAGAALFIVSDAILASERFLMPGDTIYRQWAGPAIWITYYAAQALIVLGVLSAA